MDSIVVVHTDTENTNPKLVGRKTSKNIDYLFRKIGFYLRGRVRDGDAIYYLPSSPEGKAHSWIEPALNNATIIPSGEGVQAQFLRTKEQLLEDGATDVFLAGVSIWLCLPTLCELLSGAPQSIAGYAGISREDYELIGQAYLGWDSERFSRVHDEKLPCQIIEALSDRYEHAPKSLRQRMGMLFDPFYK